MVSGPYIHHFRLFESSNWRQHGRDAMNRAFVYQIIVDGVVRYIGKGTGGRLANHMKKVRMIARRRAAGETITTTHFYNRLTKAWLAGSNIEFNVIADRLSDAEAFESERTEI